MRESGAGMAVRRFRIEGRVQGVGFRWWTRKTAQDLGLVGRVRNEPDGSVDVRAAGSPEALAALERALGEGPPTARVRAVRRETVDEEGSAHGWSEFEIER